jgi:methylthioribose-1-phosphate isomerase
VITAIGSAALPDKIVTGAANSDTGDAMNIRGQAYRTIWELPDAAGVEVIDQRVLPHRFATVALRTPEEVAAAIRDMTVRGAPLIGATGGYGVYLAARQVTGDALERAAETLAEARPTAVNLR